MTAPLPDPSSLQLYREEPIPVIVVTGFLGSGKTTFIRRLLSERSMDDTAILVSEFGEIGLDHLLVEAVSETVVLLEGGCLCCAHGGDLAVALRSLLQRRELGSVPRFQRVILETSGLADPGPILQSFMADPLNLSIYRLSTVIAVVDGERGIATLRSYPEAERQLAFADAVFISKQDRGAFEPGLLETLTAQYPGLRICRCLAEVPDQLFRLGVSKALDVPGPIRPIGHRSRFASCSRRIEHDLASASVEEWMSRLLSRTDPILRMKAVLPIVGEDRPIVLHLVGHRVDRMAYLPGWPTNRAGAVTLIGEHRQRKALQDLANQLA